MSELQGSLRTALNGAWWMRLAEKWSDPNLAVETSLPPMRTPEELSQWMDRITLSREQLDAVTRQGSQMLIRGRAGTGKSLALLYRLLNAMDWEDPGLRFLYVSFNATLIQDTRKRLQAAPKFAELLAKHGSDAVEIHTFHQMAYTLLGRLGVKVPPYVAGHEAMVKASGIQKTHAIAFVENFLDSEAYRTLPDNQKLFKTHDGLFFLQELLWIKANGFITEEAYLNCERAGRGLNPRLTREQRRTIFRMFQEYHRIRVAKYYGEMDAEDYALKILEQVDAIPDALKYDYVFVDEVQDLQPMQLLALSNLCKKSMTLSGDSRQRIYRRSPVTFRSLGIDVDGRRTRNLRINYRSTKQIMRLANALSFRDDEHERIAERYFVREGPKPGIRHYASVPAMTRFLIGQMQSILAQEPSATIAVVHRYDDDLNAVFKSPIKADLASRFMLITTAQYGARFDLRETKKPIFFTDVYSVKGLEFDYVFVVHFSRYRYPSQTVMADLQRLNPDRTSEAYLQDEQELLNAEKKLLYVAITRARKALWLLYTGSSETDISPFAREFRTQDYEAHGFRKTRIQ